MAVKDIKDRAKAHFCSRDLSPGDLVKVTDGFKGKAWEHKVGGHGHWAVFVKRAGKKVVVRPMRQNGVIEQPIEVNEVQHVDDVIQNAALREYMEKRGGGEE